jgi:NitT/TauT family transport system substrate-binding protein
MFDTREARSYGAVKYENIGWEMDIMTLGRRGTIAGVLSGLALPAFAQNAALEHPHVIIGAGGLFSQVAKLPIVMANSLGYFHDEGLDMELIDFNTGAKGAQALIAGNTDFVAGAYEHTIDLQAKGFKMVAVVGTNRYPGYILGVVKSKGGTIKSVADLKGKSIGVSGPGSATQIFAVRALQRVGLTKDDASYVGVGLGPTAVAAVRAGEIDAIVTQDPATTEMWNDIIPLIDSRDAEGTKFAYGGDYMLDSLYTTADFIAKNPRTVQAVVNAVVRTMLWVTKAPIEDVIAKVPPQYIKDKEQYRQMLKGNISAMQFDGKINDEMAKNAMDSVSIFEPQLRTAHVDLTATYTNRFVDEALKKYQ